MSKSKDVAFKNRDRFIELGLKIAALRKMQGMSQEVLAEKAGISRSHLSSIEAPNIVRPFFSGSALQFSGCARRDARGIVGCTVPLWEAG